MILNKIIVKKSVGTISTSKNLLINTVFVFSLYKSVMINISHRMFCLNDLEFLIVGTQILAENMVIGLLLFIKEIISQIVSKNSKLQFGTEL